MLFLSIYKLSLANIPIFLLFFPLSSTLMILIKEKCITTMKYVSSIGILYTLSEFCLFFTEREFFLKE